MSGFAKFMTQKRHRERMPKAPKGFDISLLDAITEYNLSQEQIQKLGELTTEKKIAFAPVGRDVFYRRATLERLFNGEQA